MPAGGIGLTGRVSRNPLKLPIFCSFIKNIQTVLAITSPRRRLP